MKTLLLPLQGQRETKYSHISSGNPLQYSCLENPKDRGARWATVHGVAKSWTQLSDFTLHTSSSYLFLQKETQDKLTTVNGFPLEVGRNTVKELRM